MRNDKLYFGIGIALILVIGTMLSALTNNQVTAKLEREAISATETAIPTAVLSMLQTAQQRMGNQQWDEAIPILQEIVTLDPESIQGNQSLLQAYVESDQVELADAYVQDLTAQREEITEARDRDWIDIVVIRYYNSIEAWQDIIDYVESADPEITTKQVDYPIATAYYSSEEYENAQIYFLKIVSSQPTSEPAQFRLGQIALELEDYESAVDYFSIAHGLKADRLESIYYRGVAYYELGEIELAREDFTTYTDMGGRANVSAYFE